MSAMGAAAIGLTFVTQPWRLYIVFLSGAALNVIVAPWFERKRGLEISIAFNGAAVGGVLLVPALVFLEARIGFRAAVLPLVTVMVAVLTPLVLWLLVRGPEVLGLVPDADGPTLQATGMAADGDAGCRRLGRQPDLDLRGAGTPGSGLFVDRVNRRAVIAGNLLLQTTSIVLMLSGPGPGLLYVTCAMFGLGVGNTTSLPSVIVQAEFLRAAFGQVVSTIIAINQFTYSFGPGLLGWLRDWTGSYDAAFADCLTLQLAAAGILLFGGSRRRESAASPASA